LQEPTGSCACACGTFGCDDEVANAEEEEFKILFEFGESDGVFIVEILISLGSVP
jgi:hypothetical protein